jgi:diaminopimelate decarboxylase
MTTSYDQTEDGGLRIEGVSVDELAAEYGTPLFVYSEATLRRTFRRFAKAFADRYPAEVIVCAGLKANYNQAIRRVIVSEGGGGDVFGIGEMTAALAAGSDPRKVVMNGPCKPRDAIRQAIEAGILINLDSTSEVESVAGVARELGRVARISIRLRLGMDVLDGKYWVDPRYPPPGVDLGPEMRTEKFGMEPSAAERALKASLDRPEFVVEGIHYHGGQSRRAGFYREELEATMDAVETLRNAADFTPVYLNIGGGFLPEREDVPPPPTAEEYADVICGIVVDRCRAISMPVPVLMVEPGRYIVESAGTFLTRVVGVKRDDDLARKTWAYVDGNTNELCDPLDPFPGRHRIVVDSQSSRVAGNEVVDVCGQLCSGDDVLARDVSLPLLDAGDLLAFRDVGAYNEAFSGCGNAVPRSAAVLVSDGRSALVRRRETVEDLFARDVTPEWLEASPADRHTSSV